MRNFSWRCPHCGYSIIAPELMGRGSYFNKCTALMFNGDLYIGDYDGKGTINTPFGYHDLTSDRREPEIYHYECWLEEGEPCEFYKPSQPAADYGIPTDPETLLYMSSLSNVEMRLDEDW